MRQTPSDEADVRRLAEAAAWRVRLAEEELESCPEFEQWLAADPANEAAWRRVEAPWDLFGEQATASRVIAARRDALDRAHRASAAAAATGDSAVPAHTAGWSRAARALAVVCVTVLCAVIIGWWSVQPDVYRTGLGERREVVLADGSKVSLDSATELRVKLSDEARRLELLKGQARFDVAHDATRPFSVRAGGQRVVALGTAFNIDMLDSKLLITLIEGRVEVVPDKAGAAVWPTRTEVQQAPAPTKPLTLTPGQQLALAPQAPPVVRPTQVATTTAWTEGQLIFTNEPLAAVAERVSRYAGYPITAAPEVASLRVSGVFQSHDVPGFIATIGDYLPVQAEKHPDGGVLLARKE